MSNFQGFKITAIDPDRLDYPYTHFHILLEPINVDKDDMKIWKITFKRLVADWNRTGGPSPRLDVFDTVGDPSIWASETNIGFIGNCISDIKDFVQKANKETLRLIEDRDNVRANIALINSENFGN